MLRKSLVRLCAACIFSLTALALPVQAAETSVDLNSPEVQRAKNLLQSAVKFYKEKGDRALLAFNQQDVFTDGELYVFVINSQGRMLASGGSSSNLVNQDVLSLKDADGKPFIQDMIKQAHDWGRGEVEYRWLNRVDGQVERKLTFFEKVDDRIIAVGFYLPRATPEQAKALLDQAVTAVEKNPVEAFDEFNKLNSKFKLSDLYVFAVNIKDGKFVAHGSTPKLVGTNAKDIADPNGKPIVAKMLKLVEKADKAEIDYEWRNPITRRIEHKRSLLRKVGDYLVAVGYYSR